MQNYKVVAREKPPFLYVTPNCTKPYSGYSIDLLDTVSALANFTYDLYIVPDGKIGTANDYAEWDGMAGELTNGFADIALGPIPMLSENDDVMDYSYPIFRPTGLRFLMKQFKTDSFFTFVNVIDTPIIGAVIAGFFITTIMFWLFEHWSPYSSTNNGETKGTDTSLGGWLFFLLLSLTPNRSHQIPRHLSGRLLVTTWWLFGFLLVVLYTANLSTYLTLSKMRDPITTWDDLRRQHTMQYAPLNDSDEMLLFKKLNDIEVMFRSKIPQLLDKYGVDPQDYTYAEKHVPFWQGMQRTKMPATTEEALARVTSSSSPIQGFTFIADASDVRYLTMVRCDLIAAGEEVSVKHHAFGFRKDLNLTADFNKALMHLTATSFLGRLEATWWMNSSRSKNCPRLERGFGGVDVTDVAVLFAVLAVGILTASIIITCQYYMYQGENEPKKNIVEVISKPDNNQKDGEIFVQNVLESGDDFGVHMRAFQNKFNH